MSYNKIIVVGRVGKDADVKDRDDQYVVNFTLCVSEKSYKNKDEYDSQWFNVQFWAKSTAQANIITKGSTILVEGAMRSRIFEKDGQKNTYWYIAASKVDLLSSANNGGQKKSDNASSKGESKAPAPEKEKKESKINRDDIPF